MNSIKTISLSNLPKVSANKFYAGTHWTKRAELKRVYELIIESKIKDKLPLFDSDKHDIVIRYSCGSVKGCDDNVFIEVFSV